MRKVGRSEVAGLEVLQTERERSWRFDLFSERAFTCM